jgi:hypothetical protein
MNNILPRSEWSELFFSIDIDLLTDNSKWGGVVVCLRAIFLDKERLK